MIWNPWTLRSTQLTSCPRGMITLQGLAAAAFTRPLASLPQLRGSYGARAAGRLGRTWQVSGRCGIYVLVMLLPHYLAMHPELGGCPRDAGGFRRRTSTQIAPTPAGQ